MFNNYTLFITDKSQGLLSWICNLIVTFLVFLVTFITFPISGWFVLKVSSKHIFRRVFAFFKCFLNIQYDFQVVPNYERIVVFRLGRIRPPKGPGVVLVLPFIDQWQKVDLRTRAFSVPPCKVQWKNFVFFSSITFKNSSFYKPSILRFPQFSLPKGHHQRRWSGVGWSGYPVPDLESGDVRGGGAGSERLHPPHRTERHDADPEQKDLERDTDREDQTRRTSRGERQIPNITLIHLLVNCPFKLWSACVLQMDMNEMTKPWGLEVDRVELILEGVLREPNGGHAGPLIMPPRSLGWKDSPDPYSSSQCTSWARRLRPNPVKVMLGYLDL